ncbi:MAG: hypothetical protein J5I92_15115 [Thiogranum sp.]|nr:hypothetical protein [Thiogranum sp.]
MNLFDKRTFLRVARVIQGAQAEVPYNKTWQRVHRETGAGVVQGSTLTLSAQDREKLRQLAALETGADPARIALDAFRQATRTETADLVKDEKWAKRGVRDALVQVCGLNHQVKLDQTYAVPDGGYLGLRWQQVVAELQAPLVVVENLAAFLAVDAICWPEALREREPLFVYRGDPVTTPAPVYHLLSAYTGETAAFCDYDPAGMVIALTLPGNAGVLVPADGVERLKSHSRPDLFDRQSAALARHLARETRPEALRLGQTLLKSRLAVMQERMIAHRLPLSWRALTEQRGPIRPDTQALCAFPEKT